MPATNPVAAVMGIAAWQGALWLQITRDVAGGVDHLGARGSGARQDDRRSALEAPDLDDGAVLQRIEVEGVRLLDGAQRVLGRSIEPAEINRVPAHGLTSPHAEFDPRRKVSREARVFNQICGPDDNRFFGWCRRSRPNAT